MTELSGIAADRVSAFAWALSSLFAGMAGVLIAPRFNTLAAPDFFNLVVVGVAAAAIGTLVSLPRALLGGVGLGIFIAVLNTFLPRWSDDLTWLRPLQDNLTPAIPFVVLFGVLVLVPSIRRARETSDPLAGVDPPPPSLGYRRTRRTFLTRVPARSSCRRLVVFTRADQVWLFLVTQAGAVDRIPLTVARVSPARSRCVRVRSAPSARSPCSSWWTATTCPCSSPR
jgi:hypothetical protein